jgi:hypothetical protein
VPRHEHLERALRGVEGAVARAVDAVVRVPVDLGPLSDLTEGGLARVGARDDVVNPRCRDQILQRLKVAPVVSGDELIDEAVRERLTKSLPLRRHRARRLTVGRRRTAWRLTVGRASVVIPAAAGSDE